MKPSEGKKIIKDCLDRGWVKVGDKLITPAQAKQMPAVKRKRAKKAIKTGWIDDDRNIRNKAKHTDQFVRLIEIEFGLTVFPEFYFDVERKWRIDYAIPLKKDGSKLKLAIEVEGGAFTGGRHTRPMGFINDMEKYNKMSENGWILIRIIPANLLSLSTLQKIKAIIFNGK